MRRALAAAILLAIVAAMLWPIEWEGPPAQLPLQVPAPSPSAAPFPLPSRPVFSPPIRVNLTPSGVRQLDLAIDGPYQVRVGSGGRIVARGRQMPATTVTATADGFRVGSSEHRGDELHVVAETPPSIWVNDHQYRGELRLVRLADGELLAINVLPIEQYLASVVDSEMPIAFGEAARQAQAVVARTYAHFRRHEARGHPHFDLYSTSKSQRYLGFQYRTEDGRRLAGESDSSRAVVAATAGVVCTWDGKLFSTYYSACCGGQTTQGDRVFTDAVPAFKSVPCTWCADSRYYRWTARLSRDEAAAHLREYFQAEQRPFGTLTTLTLAARQDPVGVPVLEATDGRHRHTVSAATLRRQLPPSTLPSPHFRVRTTADAVIFEGRGHGHGVGLCQWGARGQALAGRSCRDILNYYYPGAQLVRITGEKP